MVVAGLFTATVLRLTVLEVVNAKPPDGSTRRSASKSKAIILPPPLIFLVDSVAAEEEYFAYSIRNMQYQGRFVDSIQYLYYLYCTMPFDIRCCQTPIKQASIHKPSAWGLEYLVFEYTADSVVPTVKDPHCKCAWFRNILSITRDS